MSTSNGSPGLSPALADERLENLRSAYEQKVIERARRTVRVTTYVLASSVAERRADQELIEAHVRGEGWKLALSSFWDFGQAPPVTDRTSFGEASRYAAQGFAHGIVAIGRPAITTDDAAYEELLDFLGSRGVFLAYLSGPTR
ncbi:hypothetical protein ABZV34_31445 [Streptomyces sp. NPDC005195]|uniref:hypothetical protein n=1 Tax=Streptomyces sp. NPDC005195 TaxID=3154561 RepID=UPI0033A8567C